MTLLVTGSDGFVGGVLVGVRPCVALLDGGRPIDLRDADGLNQAIKAISPTAVIHLAAQSFVPASFANPRETYDINFLGTFNLLQALERAGFKGRLLFVGTGDGYGLVQSKSLPVTESHPLRPRSPYAVSKVAAEALCYQWSQVGPFEVVMTRSFNHIGPGQSERFVISDFARQVVEIRLGRRDPVICVGDIEVTRDFTDVRDVVGAYLALLDGGRNGETYNVCSGNEQRISSILARLLQLAGVEARVELDTTRFRRAEQRRACGCNQKIRKDTNWAPAIELDTSLADVMADWERKLK